MPNVARDPRVILAMVTDLLEGVDLTKLNRKTYTAADGSCLQIWRDMKTNEKLCSIELAPSGTIRRCLYPVLWLN